MPVYGYSYTNALQKSVADLAAKFFAYMPLIMTEEDFIAAFVDPEHLPILRQAQEVAGVDDTRGFVTLLRGKDEDAKGGIKMRAEFWGRKAPVLMPQYARYGLQKTAPAHILERVQAHVDERVALGLKFATVHTAVNFLNDTCDTAAALQTLMPCLPALVAEIGGYDPESRFAKKAAKMAQSRSIGTIPALPREVKVNLREASALVNSVALMSDAPVPELHKGQVMLRKTDYMDSGSQRHPFAGLRHIGTDATTNVL